MRICVCLLKIFFVTRGTKKIFLHTHTCMDIHTDFRDFDQKRNQHLKNLHFVN